MLTVKFFNPYEYAIPVVAENTLTKATYTCKALTRQRGELLEGYEIAKTTLATYPRLQFQKPEVINSDNTEKV